MMDSVQRFQMHQQETIYWEAAEKLKDDMTKILSMQN